MQDIDSNKSRSPDGISLKMRRAKMSTCAFN